MTRNLLIVDDEPSIISALKRIFRRSDCTVFSANSGQEALEHLQQEQISVILTDYRMPGMTGTELLSEVSDRWPDIYRILLTGQADLEAVMAAINEGRVNKFLLKPWDSNGLRNTLDEAFKHFELSAENRRLTEELQSANQRLERMNADLTERVQKKAQELSQAVYYDSLTCLPNRVLLSDRLAQMTRAADSGSHQLQIMLIGLDRFKMVNDSMGHIGGDELLVQFSQRLSNSMPEQVTLARIGGDEFCLLLFDRPEHQDADHTAEQIRQMLSEPFDIQDREIFLTTSIGICSYPDDGQTSEELLRNADAALHSAKEDGRDTLQYYSRQMNNMADERLSLANDLRRALERDEFVLYFQPKVETSSAQLVGAEALIRWQHPERGLISPGEFIPLLEESGLVVPVGEWIIRTTCEVLESFRERDFPPIAIAANLSPRQFWQGDLVHSVSEILRNSSLMPLDPHLELEITESLVMKHESETRRILQDLSDMGIKLAIDDFGTGYSSFSYLTSFPINYLKVDRYFISQISISREGETVVNAIVSMARELKLKVIAEGVETPAQLSFLRTIGCDQVQGYLFGRPMARQDFEALVLGSSGGAPLLQGNTG